MLKEDPKAAKSAFSEAAKQWCPSCEKFIRHREGVDWCRDHKMSEKTLQGRVMDRAKRRGWDIKHVGKGIAAFDAVGAPIFVSTARSFPDLFLLNRSQIGPDGKGRRLAIELKREAGTFEPGQLEYLQLLNDCGIDAVCIRPHHLRDGTVNAILSAR
jgi:hypothetical protein